MMGLESLIRKSAFLPVVGMLACNGPDSEQPQDTGICPSDSAETCDTDSGDTDTYTTCDAPVIDTSTLNQTAYLNTPFTYTVAVKQDDNAGALTCHMSELPFDVTYSDNGCTLAFTVTDDFMVGETYNVAIEAKDSCDEDEATLELTIAENSSNTAPEITTTSLSSATVNTAYSATVSATDAENDTLTYSLVDGPSWLSMNSSGKLSGTPTSSGTSTVEVKVVDPDGLYDTASYSLLVASVASVDMYVIDGDSGAAADSSCSIDVTLTNSTSGYSETVTMNSSGVAAFSLDETGLYNISVPSTNTGSNCYGGVSLDKWIDVSAGTNSGWVTLIPESYQDEVVDVVGDQITTYRDGSAWTCDSVTDLVKYMSGVWSAGPYIGGWNNNIRDGIYDLEVDTIDFENNGIQYNDGLLLAISYLDGHLAPSVVQVVSGGDIWFTKGSEWSLEDVNYDGTGYTITDAEIEYTTVGSSGDEYTVATDFSHEIIHVLLGGQHTNVDVYIMDSSPTVDKPHEQELLVLRVVNNIGPQNPAGGRVDLYNGYLE